MADYRDEAPIGRHSELEERMDRIERNLETFARSATEAKHMVGEVGKDVAQIDEEVELLGEKVASIYEAVYSEESGNLTPGERLQYAIDLGAGPQDVDTYFNALVIAIGEYSGLLTGDAATERLREMSDLIEVYQRHREERFNEYLGEDGD